MDEQGFGGDASSVPAGTVRNAIDLPTAMPAAVVLGDLSLVRPLSPACVVVATGDSTEVVRHSRHVHTVWPLPAHGPGSQAAELRRLLTLGRALVDGLGTRVPLFYGSDWQLELLYRNRQALSSCFLFQINDDGRAWTLHDKASFYVLCEKLGIRVPRMLLTGGEDEATMEEILGRWKMPLLVKPKRKPYGAALRLLGFSQGHKARPFADGDELLAERALLAMRDLVIQELIPSHARDIYSFHGFCADDGRLLAWFCGHKLRTHPSFGGESSHVPLAKSRAFDLALGLAGGGPRPGDRGEPDRLAGGPTMLKTRVLDDISELQALTTEWSALLQRSANNTPTLSPGWLLPWWELFGEVDNRELRTVEFRDGPRLVGLAPLSLRRCTRGRYRGLHRLELLGSGEDDGDAIASDCIGVIAETGGELAVARSMAEMLTGTALGRWDDALFDSMNGDDLLPLLLAREARALGMHVAADMAGASPHIVLPDSWDGYLASLTQHRRKSLKQSLQYFERWAGQGHLFRRATSSKDLDEGYGILVDLHRARWAQASHSGVFASPRYSNFHQTVMPWLLQKGALDLTWLCVHDQPVAVSYSIEWNGRLHFYQGGRSLQVPANVQPGLVLQAHNIRVAIAAGLHEYDFLAGISPYKINLATATRPLMRVRIVHPSVRTNLLQVAGVVRRQIRAVAAHPGSHPIAGRVMRAVLRHRNPART